MDVRNGFNGGINSFALVSYLSGPLAVFLDELRRDFAPDSQAKAHITLLPPRPLQLTPRPETIERSWKDLKDRLQDFPPVRVDLGEVEVFPLNRVIYLSLVSGAEQLRVMHDALDSGLLRYQEPFPYHPHVTVVQELLPQNVPAAAEFARWRWSEFRQSHGFVVERISFVQNTVDNSWRDLAELDLANQLAL